MTVRQYIRFRIALNIPSGGAGRSRGMRGGSRRRTSKTTGVPFFYGSLGLHNIHYPRFARYRGSSITETNPLVGLFAVIGDAKDRLERVMSHA